MILTLLKLLETLFQEQKSDEENRKFTEEIKPPLYSMNELQESCLRIHARVMMFGGDFRLVDGSEMQEFKSLYGTTWLPPKPWLQG